MDLCSRLFFVCWFGRTLVRSWLLALLQLLLLLGVFLCQLLGLLLMLLLKLLLFRFICRTLRETLMILLLSGLEFLALIDLLYLEFLLLLLIFLVLFGVARVWSDEVFRWRKIPDVDHGAWARGLDVRASGLIGGASSVVRGRGWGGVNRSTFFGGYCARFPEGAGLGCSGDGRFAVIGGGA